MTRNEKKFLENIEKSINYEGDFNKISDKIIVNKSFYKKTKRPSFNIAIFASLASVFAACFIVIFVMINNLNSLDNPQTEQSIVEKSDIIDGLPSDPENAAGSEEIEDTGNNAKPNDSTYPESDIPQAPEVDGFVFQGNIYQIVDENISLDLVGEKIGEIDGNDIFMVINEETYDRIIIKIGDMYYLLEIEK